MQQHPAFVVKGFQELVCRMNLHVQVQDGALIAAPLLYALSDKSRFGLGGSAVAEVLLHDAAIGLANAAVPKLPAPKEEDLSKGILESIDMDSYRVEKHAAMQLQMPDEDAEIEPVPTSGGGRKPGPELDTLSNILKAFNDQFGNIPWLDTDRVHKMITEEIPSRVAADTAYQNAKKQGDKSKARIEHDAALRRVMVSLLKDDTELFKQYSDNEGFKRWLADTVFGLTYEDDAA